jgi:hypothetical protein
VTFAGGPVPEGFEREVAASPAGFERDLRKAWPGGVALLAPGRFRIVAGELALDIAIEPLGTRRLGLIELPRLAVRYRFEGGDEAARRRLLTVLDRAMQRGGG